MIRDALREEIPRLVEMGKEFLASSKYSNLISENGEQFAKLGNQVLDSGGSILVAEQDGEPVGMLGFIIYDHCMSGEKMAGEVFWWVNPKDRGSVGIRLLREAEAKAKAAGAKKIQMIAPDDGVGTIYRRFGYEFVESTYQRTL